MARFLVLGSNSFSGSSFISEAINQGNEVLAISRSEQPNQIFLPYALVPPESQKVTTRTN